MPYNILPYTVRKAKELNVIVKPSKNKKKKIDVFDSHGAFICSIGAIGYFDYPTFIETYGVAYATQKRRLYKLRHESDRHIKNSAGWFADQLLW